MSKPIRLIGAPTDVGAGARGASMGPEALRVAGLCEALRGLGLHVADAGNLQGPGNPWQPPVDGWRHLPEVVAWNRAVFGAVTDALSDSQLPIVLGGDHSLAIGSISAVASYCRARGRRLRVLWLDAHAAGIPCTLPLGVMALVLKSACASNHSTRRRRPRARQYDATALMDPMARLWSPPSTMGN